MRFPEHHDEVVSALKAIGNPRYGAAVAADRVSKLTHLGISFPDLRRRVKQGFSFYALPAEDVRAVWDDLWRGRPTATSSSLPSSTTPRACASE
jgi:hypothetical protein